MNFGSSTASRRKKWPFILGIFITILVVAGVIAAVLWFYGKTFTHWCPTVHLPGYFLLWCPLSTPTGMFDCLQGRPCKTDNKCVSFSQWCDGVQDCQSGDDETQCCKNPLSSDMFNWSYSKIFTVLSVVVFVVRLFGSNFLLQMYSNVTQKWENVCSDEWNNNLGMQACEEMGYERWC